jgi:hypothetical protein
MKYIFHIIFEYMIDSLRKIFHIQFNCLLVDLSIYINTETLNHSTTTIPHHLQVLRQAD